MIESIASVGQSPATAIAVPSLEPTPQGSSTSGVDFGTLIDGQLSKVNREVGAAENALQRLASGQPVELHDVMISLEKARISVQTVIHMRNRLIEAYQEVSRMQV